MNITSIPGEYLPQAEPAAGNLPVPLTNIRIALFIGSPISYAVGSSIVYFSQPLTEAKVPVGGIWVIVIDLIIQIVALLARRSIFTLPSEALAPSVTLSMSELTGFLRKLKQGVVIAPDQDQQVEEGTITRPGVQIGSPSYLTIYLWVTGYVDSSPAPPQASLFVPIISFQGITGGLPVIIISLIATILERNVVPPSCSGIYPVSERKEEPEFKLKLNEVVNLLKGSTQYFNYKQ